MFFRSSRSLALAIILMVVAVVQLIFGLVYADAAKRETSTVGTITRVIHGKSSTYEYVFHANGLKIADDSSSCKTALTQQGCVEGAPVLVYYDRDHLSETRLQEFGAASKEKFFFGGWMAGVGLLLVGLYFTLRQVALDPEGDDEPDSNSTDQPEVLHIVPDK